MNDSEYDEQSMFFINPMSNVSFKVMLLSAIFKRRHSDLFIPMPIALMYGFKCLY